MLTVFEMITFFGSFKWLFPATVGAVGVFLLKNKFKEAATLTLGMSLAVIITEILKIVIREPRPHLTAAVVETSFSFPSGHSVNSTVFYLLLFYLLKINRVWALPIICLIGFSRIYLGVHYYWDVGGGILIGLLIYQGAKKIFNNYLYRWFPLAQRHRQ